MPFAPTFEFMRDTLFPWLEKLGVRLEARMESIGFMQYGGGRVIVDITPAAKLQALDARQPGDILKQTLSSGLMDWKNI